MIERKRGWLPGTVHVGCLVLFALIALSCSQDPTDQNSPTSPVPLSGVQVRDTTIYALHDSTFKYHIPMDGSTNLVGSAGGYTAMSVLEFYPSYFVLRDTVNVVSATVKLRLSYALGSTPGNFSFDVYQVLRTWDATTLRWDSVQTGFYDAATKRGSFSQTITSDTGFIYVNLDTTMVRQWISSTATADQKYGIMLVPTTSSAVRGFVQYSTGDSATYYPSLQVICAGISGNTLDTASYATSTATFVADVNLPTDPTILQVQAGVAYRSRLLFDVSFIPRGTTINSAILSLDVAPAYTQLNSFTTDSTLSANLGTSDDPTSIEATGALLYPTSTSLTTESGDVSHAVQSWVRTPNYGLVLRVSSPAEINRLDRYGFYGVHASTATTRPRIKITYSLGKR